MKQDDPPEGFIGHNTYPSKLYSRFNLDITNHILDLHTLSFETCSIPLGVSSRKLSFLLRDDGPTYTLLADEYFRVACKPHRTP